MADRQQHNQWHVIPLKNGISLIEAVGQPHEIPFFNGMTSPGDWR